MSLRLFFLLALVLTALPARAEDICTYRPTGEIAAPLRRGVNLDSWSWGKDRPAFAEQDFKNVKALGFDFVRLPVSENFLSAEVSQEKELARLRCGIIGLLNEGLSVVLDFHPSKNFPKNEPEQALLVRTMGIWRALGRAIEGLPHDKILLSLFNEPSKSMKNWWTVQKTLVTSVRGMFPHHTLVATDVIGGYWGLNQKTPYADPNVVYDFHFYQPMFFTHHNTEWRTPKPDPREKTDALKYPSSLETNDDPTYKKMVGYKSSNWGKARLASRLELPIAWSRKTGAKVLCLEFGVYRPYVDPPSRARWLQDMREILEENGVPWAVWEYNKGFGIVGKDNKIDPAIAQALGLGATE